MTQPALDPVELLPRRRSRRLRLPVSGVIGAAIVLLCVAVAAFGWALAPYDAGAVIDYEVFKPVSAAFPLGTDYLGRDMLSRVLLGARYTVGIAGLATLLACGAGVCLGLFAAAVGGWPDALLSRTLDALTSIERGAPIVVAGSPLGDGALFRIAGDNIEAVVQATRALLHTACSRLGEDPWARKW